MGAKRARRAAIAAAVLAALTGAMAGPAGAAGATGASAGPARAPAQVTCPVPAAGAGFTRARPEQVALDAAAVARAVRYASAHGRLSVKVFRHNCLVGSGPWEAATENLRWNIWSSTKAVVSLLTGIAAGRGDLDLDDPIGRHLPAGPGWGDAAHRAVTVRQLLTQTSGLQQSIVSEAATFLTDPHVAREALAQRLVHRPGTRFEYGQRAVDLLAFVVARAVGEDLQDFAQRTLFGPIGIARSDYAWLRDRAGNTYGYAHLLLPPARYARLGLLLTNGGSWAGRQVVPAGYVRAMGRPSRANGCYGLLVWTNGGDSCTSATFPAAETVAHRMVPSAPPDMFAMVGFLQQNNFAVPSLGITVTWTGVLGDMSSNLGGMLSANLGASDLYYTFFRLLMQGVRDVDVPDPGPYVAPPNAPAYDVLGYADPDVLLRDLAPGAGCTVVRC